MNLEKQLEDARKKVDDLYKEYQTASKLRDLVTKEADDAFDNHAKAVKERDNIKSMLGVVPPPQKIESDEDKINKENKQAVLNVFRNMPNVWIMPNGLAALSGVDDITTATILRRLSKIDGIPIKHNGKRGLASKYCWVA